MSHSSAYPYRGFRRFLAALATRLCVSWVAAAMFVAVVVAFCGVLLVVTLLGSLYGLTGLVIFDFLFAHGQMVPSLLVGTPFAGYAPLLRYGVAALLLVALALFAAVRVFQEARPVAARTLSPEFPSGENLA
jgi:hypothetical protein